MLQSFCDVAEELIFDNVSPHFVHRVDFGHAAGMSLVKIAQCTVDRRSRRIVRAARCARALIS
jgi:hypothetical protein